MADATSERLSPRLTETYERDVLQLPLGQTEEDLDIILRAQARELGLIVDALPEEPTSPSEQSSRYSESLDSRVSISTGLTSIRSDGASIYSNNAAQSVRSSDRDTSRRQSTSSSTFSVSTSSTNQSKSPFRRIRALSILRLNRLSNKGCPHCPKDSPNQRRALHELPCGHRLCTQALRNVVLENVRHNQDMKCCGQMIPEWFVRHVLNGEENGEIQRYSGTAILSPTASLRQSSVKSQVDSLLPITTTGRSAEHQKLSAQHEAENEHFDVWLTKLKDNLKQQRAFMLRTLQEHQTRAIDEQAEAQLHDMLVAEDRQVKTEADLRNLHDQEIRDNATALRHMEAYCAGTLASGESHKRTITEQDLLELQKTRNLRDTMDMKHKTAINILRGEQTRRLRLRAQRHEKEVNQLEAQHRKDHLAFEQRYRLDEALLVEDAGKKRQRLHARQRLEVMVLSRRLELASIQDALVHETTTKT